MPKKYHTNIEEILDNKRAVQRLEDGHDRDNAKLVIAILIALPIVPFILHFIITSG